MSLLPTSLYNCSQAKALDKKAIETMPIDGFELMMRAGQASFRLLTESWPDAKSVTVFCGGGNNGGDGYVIAGLAKKAGFNALVYYLADPESLRGEAKAAYQFAQQHAVQIKPYTAMSDLVDGIVVDALLGIGLSGQVRGNYATAIEKINESGLPVLAVDIPSGICGDSGRVLGAAILAAETITFIAVKQGLLSGDACHYVGRLHYDHLGIGQSVLASQKPSCTRLDYSPPLLPARNVNAHKGLYGHVLVVGGDEGYGGAGIMAAESALQSGAGIVALATRGQHTAAALSRRPELIVHAIESSAQLSSLFDAATVLVLGPGQGRSQWSEHLFKASLETKLPVVLDADGLNLLAEQRLAVQRDNWVLTPHPGEASRLLGVSNRDIQNDRFAAAKALQAKYGGVVVLKGAGSIVADLTGSAVCSAGNPSMATPGMGDVLAGIIGGLLAQGMSVAEAARLGVWAHATAADQTIEHTGKYLLATEIYPKLRQLW